MNHKDLYSFNTFREIYLNVKNLKASNKSKDDRLNHQEELLYKMQNDKEKLDIKTDETNQRLDATNQDLIYQLRMRDYEITELKSKNMNLEKKNDELWKKVSIQDLMISEQE